MKLSNSDKIKKQIDFLKIIINENSLYFTDFFGKLDDIEVKTIAEKFIDNYSKDKALPYKCTPDNKINFLVNEVLAIKTSYDVNIINNLLAK